MATRSAHNLFAGHGAAVALAAAALLLIVTSLPAQAQRLSLAQRVTRLEQAQHKQDAGSGTMLVNQVQALQAQVQSLQGQVEELQHHLKQLQQANKDQYVDLDTRLRKLEGKAPAASSSSGDAPAADSSAATPAAADTTPPAAATSASKQPPAPASSGNASGQGAAGDAEQAYNTAFTALRNGQFVDSSRQFRAFIKQYPNSSLAPNAYYWLGESYYTVQNYDVALATFQKLLKLYPDSEKTPGALLKTGYCQDALKQDAAAIKTLKSVVAKYPGSSVARLAQQRLKDIQLRQAR
jgi:tol-pal system protein YbgF